MNQMMFEPTKYMFSANIKLSQVPGNTLLSHVFPSIEDFLVSSKKYDDPKDAVLSANRFNKEICVSLNHAVGADRYDCFVEYNPAQTNEDTISTDWGVNELVKVWIIDKIEQKRNPRPLKAVGLCQVLEIYGSSTTLN